MRLVPVVLLDPQAEVLVLAEALRPYHVLEGHEDFGHLFEYAQKFFNRFDRHNRELRDKDLEYLRACLLTLKDALAEDLTIEIDTSQPVINEVGVPIILDPEKALGVLKEIRERQIAKVDEALEIHTRIEVLLSTVLNTNHLLHAFRHQE